MVSPLNREPVLQSAEALAGDADNDPYSRWIGGFVFAAVPVVVALMHFAAAAGWNAFHWLYVLWHLHDPRVMAWTGVVFLAMGLFVHAHYFWTPHPRLHAIGHAGKIAAAAIIAFLLLLAVIGGFAGFFEVPHLRR